MERIKTVGTITGVLLLACGILNFTVGIGTIYIGFQQTAQILWQIFQGTANGNILADVIYYLRLPRLVLAAVVGYGLSITGCVMQAVMRNSLADPYLLGISSGAGLGAVIAIILGFTSVAGFDAIGCFAFLGAFAVTIFIVLLSLRFGKSGTTAILLSGMAANMIGVNKAIIVVAAGPFQFAMVNPVITKKSGEYQTEESCLSLDGARNCTRYKEIEVDYLDQNFKPQHGKYSGWTAQIIQHEIDHCNGVAI